MPRPLRAAHLENALWGGFSRAAQAELENLSQNHPSREERLYAAWALMRWHASHLDWQAALSHADALGTELPRFLDHPGLSILRAEVLWRTRNLSKARHVARELGADRGYTADVCLAAANVRLPLRDDQLLSEDDLRLHWINQALSCGSLPPLTKIDPARPLALDNLRARAQRPARPRSETKISVIMPMYNAEPFVRTALHGLLGQTWGNLEILVVDDCSHDNGPALVADVAHHDPRVKLIRLARNSGAYAARNAAIKHATGDLITTHDSDDWSHPERLERMATPLVQDTRLVATLGHWARTDSQLHFRRWRMEDGLVHASVSTLMFRRDILESLGGWDEVRIAADTEFLQRVIRKWGQAAVGTVLAGVPLVLARESEESLTSSTATHLRTQFWGLRRLYGELAEAWHARQENRGGSLNISPGAPKRPFPVPSQIVPGQRPASRYDDILMADCGPTSPTLPWLRAILEQASGQAKIAVFHWPDMQRLEELSPWLLDQALDGRIELLLPESDVHAKRLIVLGGTLEASPPDGVPHVGCTQKLVIGSLRELDRLIGHVTEATEADDIRLLKNSDLFNAEWYLHHYHDVRNAGADPHEHYVRHGWKEGREPGLDFDAHYYTKMHQGDGGADEAPLLHFLKTGKRHGAKPGERSLPGKISPEPGRVTVLLCAHAAGETIFGAERSLLDILEACEAMRWNVIVTVPTMLNGRYIDALRAKSVAVVRVFCDQWNAQRQPCPWAIRLFARIIREHAVNMVFVNTIMVREPLMAARQENVPGIVFVREVVNHDETLQQTIGLSPQQIQRAVWELTDYIAANSAFTAGAWGKPDKTFVVGNIIDLDNLDLRNPIDPRAIRVALISSNLPKKGILDFTEIARMVFVLAPWIRMLLIGPENSHTKALLRDTDEGTPPPNLTQTGYAATPREAIAQANIVVNLSHVEETFGRTILEAMAARRPVIAYDRGALPELIEDGGNGFLVPFQDKRGVAEKIVLLATNVAQVTLMGAAGRQKAMRFGKHTLTKQLEHIRATVLGSRPFERNTS